MKLVQQQSVRLINVQYIYESKQEMEDHQLQMESLDYIICGTLTQTRYKPNYFSCRYEKREDYTNQEY